MVQNCLLPRFHIGFPENWSGTEENGFDVREDLVSSVVPMGNIKTSQIFASVSNWISWKKWEQKDGVLQWTFSGGRRRRQRGEADDGRSGEEIPIMRGFIFPRKRWMNLLRSPHIAAGGATTHCYWQHLWISRWEQSWVMSVGQMGFI